MSQPTPPAEADRFAVTISLSVPANVGETEQSIETYIRESLETLVSIDAVTVSRRRGRW